MSSIQAVNGMIDHVMPVHQSMTVHRLTHGCIPCTEDQAEEK
jgi:hypothetical protein